MTFSFCNWKCRNAFQSVRILTILRDDDVAAAFVISLILQAMK